VLHDSELLSEELAIVFHSSTTKLLYLTKRLHLPSEPEPLLKTIMASWSELFELHLGIWHVAGER